MKNQIHEALLHLQSLNGSLHEVHKSFNKPPVLISQAHEDKILHLQQKLQTSYDLLKETTSVLDTLIIKLKQQ